MNVQETIEKRRAYRSLDSVTITKELLDDLARAAQLAPSCFNNQPWRFVFAYDAEILQQLCAAMSKSNVWPTDASMIIAVFSHRDLDCKIKGRDYYLFDTGMTTAFIILRATELNLVAHPIAGFNEDKVREILNIPNEMTVITLVIVGKHAAQIKPTLTEKQAATEAARPERKPLTEFAFMNRYEAPEQK